MSAAAICRTGGVKAPRLVARSHPLPLTEAEGIVLDVFLEILAALFLLVPLCFLAAAYCINPGTIRQLNVEFFPYESLILFSNYQKKSKNYRPPLDVSGKLKIGNLSIWSVTEQTLCYQCRPWLRNPFG